MSKACLMVLASPHLDNPGLDVLNLQVDDVLAPPRQEEIAELVRRVARFRPTKVALEVPRERDGELNEAYRGYLAGSVELSRSEVHQIGFRLARSLGHPQVYGVDSFPESSLDTDFLSFARAHGQADLLEEALRAGQEQVAREAELLARGTLLDLYIAMNRPEALKAGHRVYFTLARIGSGERYPGANWVQEWYGRNLRIWVNLARVTEQGDRVFLLIGAGHAYLVRQFAEESGLYELVDPLAYLEKD